MTHANIYVSHFKQGDHTCLFYDDPAEQIAAVGPYVLAGLRNNERCLCIQQPTAKDGIIAFLSANGLDAEREIERRALIFVEPADAYTYRSDGSLDQEGMLKLVAQSLEDALAAGYSGFRPTGEVIWSLDDSRCAQLVGYEKQLDRYLPGTRATGMCQYDIRRFAPEHLDSIIRAHRIGLLSSRAGPRTMRVRSGKSFADISVDYSQSHVFEYRVQNEHSETLEVGQEDSLSAAISCCERYMIA